MRVIVVGASGTLGRALVKALGEPGQGHHVIEGSRTSANRVDITDTRSIEAFYRRVGPIDAVVCAAGAVPQASLRSLTTDQWQEGLNNKLMGQVRLVQLGMDQVSAGGSFTLVTGSTAYDPIRGGCVLSAVNGALEAFVKAAAVELPNGLRINAVNAPVFAEAWEQYGHDYPGVTPVATAEVARMFVKSVDGCQTGQVYRL